MAAPSADAGPSDTPPVDAAQAAGPDMCVVDPELLAAAGTIPPDHCPTALAVATVDMADHAMHPVRVQLNEISIAQGTVAAAVSDCRTAAAVLQDRLERVDAVFSELPAYTAKVQQLGKTMATLRETSAKIHMTMERLGGDVRLHARTHHKGSVVVPAALQALPEKE